jgi:plasmid stabilization system protein ParE
MGQRPRGGRANPCIVEVSYVLSPEAAAELAAAVAFCTQHFSAAVAENFLATLELKVRLVSEFPGVGTPTLNGRRLFPIGRYPYSMLYRSQNGVVQVSAIAHHSRRPGYWKARG